MRSRGRERHCDGCRKLLQKESDARSLERNLTQAQPLVDCLGQVLLEKNICSECGKFPREVGRRRCRKCLEYRSKTLETRRSAGLCLACGMPGDGHGLYCASCRDDRNHSQRACYRGRKERGICTTCSRPVEKERRLASRVECQRCSDARKPAWQKNREEHVAQLRRNSLIRKYGITPEEFAAKLGAQGGCCAICRATEPGGKSNQWHLDHDHRYATNDRRGHRDILCHSCNVSLGGFRDSPGLLRAAAEYVERHAAHSEPAA